MRPAVFLDRDGVLNFARSPTTGEPPRSDDDLVLIPGTYESVAALTQAGFCLDVITNQPDVERGLMSEETLERMHRRLLDELPIDRIEVCPHSGAVLCLCRKPKPGMIIRAADDLGLDLDASWTIGDRWVDVAAGQRARTRTILIETADSWRPNSTDSPSADVMPDHTAPSLSSAVRLIIGPTIA